MTSGGVVGWEKAEDVPCSSLSNYHFVPRDDYTRSLHTPEARGGVQWASIIITRNTFLVKFGPKNQNWQFELKFGAYTIIRKIFETNFSFQAK